MSSVPLLELVVLSSLYLFLSKALGDREEPVPVYRQTDLLSALGTSNDDSV